MEILNKDTLILRIVEARNSIGQLIENLSEQKMDAIADTNSGWSIKTLIAHLTFWERATIDCRNGRASTHSLSDVDGINANLLLRTNARTASDVVRDFKDSGQKLIEEINHLTEEELQERAPWKDGRTVWEHIADDTFVHYEEHKFKLRAWVAG